MAAMTGFTHETFAFLRDLEAHNDKAWFEANRARYERHWLEPAASFVAEMAGTMAALRPPHEAIARVNKSVRRINRDVRFSRDKRPYQASLHLVFWTGDHPSRAPAIHLVLHPDRVGYGAGQWALAPRALEAFRTAVLDDTAHATFMAAVAAAKETGCELAPPELVKLPKGLPADTGRDALLKRKSVVVRTFGRDAPPETVTGAGGIEWFAGIARRLAPMNRWLAEHLG